MSMLCRLVMFSVLMFAVVSMTTPLAHAEDQADKPTLVELQTNYGDITIKLFPDRAPKTVANFLTYVDEGFYSDTLFHRVIANFMIQGGGMTADMREKKTHDPIVNEDANGLSNKRGTIAMARTTNPHSATSQFFINVKDNLSLDKNYSGQRWGYCVFGQVVKGMSVVDEIRNVPTGMKAGHGDVPIKPVIIKKAVRVKE
jgi:peptidyl-prolyl cis-trans isomerase B (cyclophilin B)